MQSQVEAWFRPVKVLVKLLQRGHKVFDTSSPIGFTLQPADQVEIQRCTHIAQSLQLFILQQTPGMSLNDDFDKEFFGSWASAIWRIYYVSSLQFSNLRIGTHLSLGVCGLLFFLRTTDGPSVLPTDVPRSRDGFDVVGGLARSPNFGWTVDEKLRPRDIEPRIRLISSAFGLTGAVGCVKCILLPMTNDVRGDSTSSGSAKNVGSYRRFHQTKFIISTDRWPSKIARDLWPNPISGAPAPFPREASQIADSQTTAPDSKTNK